jgi:hypothetical protein
MATVIYLPKDPSQEMLAQGFAGAGAGLSKYLAQHEENKVMKEILAAPDRASAIERAVQTTSNPQVLQQRLNVINEAKPVKDTTPMEVKAYNPETGGFETKYVPRGQMESLNTPEGRRSIFGTGQTILSPSNVEEFFRQGPEGGYTSIGKAPMEARPEQAISATELARQSKEKADALAERRQQLAEDKFNALLAKGDTKTIAQELAKTRVYNSVISNLLNVKKSIGDQGQIILDFEGDSKKAEAYRNALESADEYISKYGDVNKAAVNALKATGYYDKTEAPPAPAAPAEEPGFFKRLFSPSKKSTQTEAAAATSAPQAGVAKPQTKAELDKLPKGAHFINPKDGKEYVKD